MLYYVHTKDLFCINYERRITNMLEKLLKDVCLVKKISKENKPYFRLMLVFTNGYVYETYLTNEQLFILSQILPVRE